MRTKCKLKGGIATATKPDDPATVNPAEANNTAVATNGTAKCSCLEHSTPANATANNTTKPNPPTTVAVHPATADDANILSGGDMVTTIGGSVSNHIILAVATKASGCGGAVVVSQLAGH
jgi:hypothetical protein